MTQNDNELLLKDLCARLPYGVILKVYHSAKNYINDCGETEDEHLGNLIQSIFIEGFIWFRPYLRPMSSMTEEERKEYKGFIVHREHVNAQGQEWDIDCFCFGSVSRLIDWLNAHHFDYRNLIEKNLALEAPSGMY